MISTVATLPGSALGVAVGPQDKVYVVAGRRVWIYDPVANTTTAVFGNGNQVDAGDGLPGLQASFTEPCGVAVDASTGDVYVAGGTE